jgi:diguanylate cyclase (GGDEF)-like protein
MDDNAAGGLARPRAWWRDWESIVAAAMTAYAITYVVWLASGPPQGAILRIITASAFIPMNGLTGLLALRAATRAPAHTGVRRALPMIGLAVLCVLVAHLTALYVFRDKGDPGDTWINFLYLLPYPWLLGALLALPRARRLHKEWRKFAFDTAAVLIGGGLAVWHLVVQPTALSGTGTAFSRFFDAAYPTGDIAVGFGLISAVLRRPPGGHRPALLLGGIAVFLASDLANQRVVQQVGSTGVQWTDMTFMASYCLIAWACARYARQPAVEAAGELPVPEAGEDKRALAQPFSVLPYASLALCDGLLFVEAITHPHAPWATLAGGTAVLMIVIALRQATAVRENARLVSEEFASERQALEAQLIHQAFHDPLTGLANRALFVDRVAHALARCARSGNTLAVLFLDLDNFKTVNDSLGHAAGDTLLVAAAVRLVACVRTSDTVARLGGDEFAMLIEDATEDMSATVAAERITTALREPFAIEGKEVFVTASVGIAVSGGDGMQATTVNDANATDLLRNADMAMYTAKAAGKSRYETFERRMHWEAMDRLDLEGDLRRAVEREELVLLYQPIVDLRSGAVAGAEALLRWHHPRRGILYPSQFIPIAEETGLIVGIGEWVLGRACQHAVAWEEHGHDGMPFGLTVNVSGHQLQHQELIDAVQRALTESGMSSASLVLEITESALMHHTQTMLERLIALKAIGVRLAIDDFGIGYSSLSYLQRFPIDILKIAKPFVDDVGGDFGSHMPQPALARAIIALSRTLGLQTVAEGIEVRGQVDALLALGCEFGQGYYFAKPLTAEALTAVIEGRAAQALPA